MEITESRAVALFAAVFIAVAAMTIVGCVDQQASGTISGTIPQSINSPSGQGQDAAPTSQYSQADSGQNAQAYGQVSGQQAQGGPSGSNSTFRNGMRGGFGNMTDEQRQQMQAQVQASEEQACSGKNQGDSCTLTFGGFGQQPNATQSGGQPPQARTMAGTCEEQNGTATLLCRMQRPPQ